jgi:trimeric autotransporter adhesin
MQTPTYHRRGFMRTNYFAFVVILILGAFVLATPFRSVDSSSRSRVKPNTKPISKSGKASRLGSAAASFALPSMSGESVTVYAADCTTPKVSFNLGETICAKTDGVDLTVAGNYYINWFHPNSTETNGGTITQNPQYFLFSLPLGNTEVGTWKVNIGRVAPPETSIIGNPPNIAVSAGPAIATFGSDCTTPKTSFALGDTVCARISGEPLPDTNSGVPVQRRFNWVNASGFVASATDVVSDPQTNSFTISNAGSARGAWFVNSTGNEAEAHLSTGFSVSDPAAASTDLTVGMSSPLTVNASSDLFFTVRVTNRGPDTATGVQLTDNQPVNTTFVSATQTEGEATFSCTGTSTVTCSTTSMRKGDEALIVIVYNVNGGTQDGTLISNTVNVTSATTELNSADNTYDDTSTVDSGTAPTPTCTLVCPDNITVTANTSENNVVGAHVSFEAAQTIGDCGSISTSVPSGSFFAVGTTTVSVTSQLNGGSCSFNVTVTQAPLTITCPANQSVTAAQGDTTANVSVGTPTTNPTTGVTVTGIRSDDDDDPDTPAKPLTDPYPIGVTFITWTVRETSTGRTAVCTQSITVNTAGRPNLTISCPANQTVTAPSGQCEASVNPGTPTTNPSDNDVTVEGVRSDGDALNAPYPAGVTAITWSATDAQTGQAASCTQTITVNTDSSDTTAPTFTYVPPNVSVTTDACGQIVGESELGTAEATDTGNNCSPGTVTIFRTGVPPGNFFPTGTTTLTIHARDAAGNEATATQTVTVTESPAVPPTITAPAAVTVNTGAGATSCGTVVSDATLGTPTASDNCPGVVVTRTGVPSGNIFPVGTTVVTYTATDRSGNTASANQNVTVNDNTPPVVTPPGPVTLYTGANATSCSVTVTDLNGTLGTGSATDNCPGVGAVSRSGVPSGNVFPVGTTTLTYSATDAHGNTGTAQQVVTVIDNTPPVISCPANITVDPSCPSGAVVTYSTPTATDNCGVQSVTRNAGSLASGSVFPIGTTTVTHTATDIYGNTSSCSFTVTVKTPQQVVTDLINEIDATSLSGVQKQGLTSKLNAALSAINSGQTNVACNKLNDFISQVQAYINNGTVSAAQGNNWILRANKVRNTIGCTSNPCT